MRFVLKPPHDWVARGKRFFLEWPHHITRSIRVNKHVLLFPLAACIFASPVLAAEEQSAAELYQQNCVRCHGPEVYTRPDRKITSFPALERRVQWCETHLGLRWFDEDIKSVANYLNENFYHFKP
jgi:hypothetical protein